MNPGSTRSSPAGTRHPPAHKGDAPASTIPWSPTLVARLHSDHEQLKEMFLAIVALLKARDYAQIKPSLAVFKSTFDGHILYENLRLYNYLEQALQPESADQALMQEFRREMNAIARSVVDLLRKYQADGVSDANREAFEADLREVGGLLLERIGREESRLYPMYAERRGP